MKKSRIYPYIRINIQQAYPTITITGKTDDDGCEYFGCFYNEDDAINTLELINSIWQTPLCRKDNFSRRHQPCLNYHINKCCAPCCAKIDSALYRRAIVEIVECMNGNLRGTMCKLKKEMAAASNEMKFERASIVRDYIVGLEKLQKKPKRLYTALDNKEVYLFLRAFNETCFSLFFIKNGLTLNRVDFQSVHELDEEKLNVFISDNNLGKTTVSDGLSLTKCVLEIGAHKLFVPVSQKWNCAGIYKKLLDSYDEFTLFRKDLEHVKNKIKI